MHFYIPELKALCTAENATHTRHNFYTPRGARTRDAMKWVGYLNETLDRWGGKAEVLFAPHHWPVWGEARVVEHTSKYRDTVKYIHDQTLRLANQGFTMEEIAEQLELPPSLASCPKDTTRMTATPTTPKPIELHLADAATQTNIEGKARASMNAFQHGLSGHRMILQTHEREGYRRLSAELYRDYKPANESERQFVQKIIDCHTRLNRIVAIENNILNAGVNQHTRPDSTNDAEIEAMVAQARAWTEYENSFEKLGRYESRISRQLVQYSKELDRLQAKRKAHEAELQKLRQPIQTTTVNRKPNSFGQNALGSLHQPVPQTNSAPDKLNLHQCPPAPTESRV